MTNKINILLILCALMSCSQEMDKPKEGTSYSQKSDQAKGGDRMAVEKSSDSEITLSEIKEIRFSIIGKPYTNKSYSLSPTEVASFKGLMASDIVRQKKLYDAMNIYRMSSEVGGDKIDIYIDPVASNMSVYKDGELVDKSIYYKKSEKMKIFISAIRKKFKQKYK